MYDLELTTVDGNKVTNTYDTAADCLAALAHDTKVDGTFHYVSAQCFLRMKDSRLRKRQWYLVVENYSVIA